MDVFAHNDALQFSDKLTKIAGSHGLKFGFSAERGQKQQNFQNDEMGDTRVRPVGHRRHRRAGGRPADRPSGQLQRRAPSIPQGEWRYWNIDAFAQDSWKVRPNLTLEFGVRAGFWTEQPRAERLRRLLRPDDLQPQRRARSSTRAPISASTAGGTPQPVRRRRAASTTAARLRCRASTSRGTSTARATTSCVAASACSTTGTWATSSTTRCAFRRPPTVSASARATRSNLGGGVGLTYDTLDSSTGARASARSR